MKTFIVAVFVHRCENSNQKLPYEVTAYLRDYNPKWSGYNKVNILGKDGADAKRRAIQTIKTQLVIQPDMVNVSNL